MGIYNAPSMSDNDFSTYFIKNIDECITYYENIILLGDLNSLYGKQSKMSNSK